MLIAHITDPHIGLGSAELGGRSDPVAGLRRALAHVGRFDPAPEVLLLSGDLSECGREQDYRTLQQLLAEELPGHAARAPLVLAVPGNHDRPDVARRLLGELMPPAAGAPPDQVCLHVQHGGLHFIGLDTVLPGRSHGALDGAQLDWLQSTLQRCAGQPVLIFMHHPPMITGITAMDDLGLLRGRAELATLVAAHGGVQLIAAGHMHRPILGLLGGAPVVVAPSSSHQIDLNLRPGAPLACRLEPPMIGVYRWTASDGIACHFSHVQAFEGPLPI